MDIAGGNLSSNDEHFNFRANDLLCNQWRILEADCRHLASYFHSHGPYDESAKEKFLLEYEKAMTRLTMLKDFSIQQLEQNQK